MLERFLSRITVKHILILVVILLCLILTLMVILAVKNAGQTAPTDPTETDSTTEPSGGVTVDDTKPSGGTATTEPTTQPTTQPSTGSDDELVGTKYTRTYLESLSATALTSDGWGPGTTSGGVRPSAAVNAQNLYGKYDAYYVGADAKTVYLTFDCGYEYSYTDENGDTVRVTEWILDELQKKNVKAVFFVTLSYCKINPDIVRRMISEGHTVGNHSTWHHNMTTLSIDDMVTEVMTLHNYVQQNFRYTMTLFRPPQGDFSERSLAVVQSLGYKTVLWSVAHNDWDPASQPSVDTAYSTVTGRHHNGAIYLLHAVSTTNATILGDVIDFLQGEGYQIKLLQ